MRREDGCRQRGTSSLRDSSFLVLDVSKCQKIAQRLEKKAR